MKNGVVLLAVGLSVAAFVGMMRIKTDVQQLVRERSKLASTQLQLKETKRVLEAEYAMLASPLRLAALAKSRGFTEMNITQVVPLNPRELDVNVAAAQSGVSSTALTAQATDVGIGRSAVLKQAPAEAVVQPATRATPATDTETGHSKVVGSVPADATAVDNLQNTGLPE